MVMGYITENWESDFQLEKFETREKAAEFIASEETRQSKRHDSWNEEPISREYAVIEGKFLECCKDLMSAKEVLDVLLEGSVI